MISVHLNLLLFSSGCVCVCVHVCARARTLERVSKNECLGYWALYNYDLIDKKMPVVCGLVAKLYLNQLFVTPWTVARQAPLSMGFPSQEYWSGLSFPSPGDLPDPETKPASLISCIGRWVLYHWCYLRVKGGGGLVIKSCPTLATPWTVVQQASLSTGFPRQE